MVMKGGVFEFRSRSKRRADQNLGIISPAGGTREKTGMGRNRRQELDSVDLYLKNEQYDHLVPWDSTNACGDPHPIKERKPLIIYNLPHRIQTTVSSKLLGPRVFPELKIEEDELTDQLMNLLIKQTKLKTKTLAMSRYLPSHGSGFLRFKITSGFPVVETYNPNHCYPEFDPNGELSMVRIQYVYEDVEDKDEYGNPTQKWYRLDLGKFSDVLYNNPEFSATEDPVFEVVNTVKHDLGFVQGEWFKTCEDHHSVDGPSLITEAKGFFDAFNYSISQSDQAVKYNQEPQLMFRNMSQDEMEDLIKSSMSSWNLGREGEASYLETGMAGVETAGNLRDKYRLLVGDVTRVVLLDPEKIVGSAQSAKAMEVLHGPLLDLIDELRPYVEPGLIKFIQKMIITVVNFSKTGGQLTGFQIPGSYQPTSLDIGAQWPAVFPMTMSDLQQKISLTAQATQANLISRRTGTKYIAKDFGVEDVDAEVDEVNAQPQLGGFGFF